METGFQFASDKKVQKWTSDFVAYSVSGGKYFKALKHPTEKKNEDLLEALDPAGHIQACILTAQEFGEGDETFTNWATDMMLR